MLIGLRRATTQLSGSIIGGVVGVALLYFGAPMFIGVPIAVAGSIWLSFAFGLGTGHQVAAFSAILVQVLPAGTPADALELRLLAVSVAAVSGFVVNVVVSGMAYGEIFGRRLRAVEARVFALLPGAARRGPEAAQSGFAAIAQLQEELSLALEELRWRQNWEKLRLIERIWWRAGRLRHLLHVASEVGYMARATSTSDEALAPFLSWIARPEGQRPDVPPMLEGPAQRLVSELLALASGVASATRPTPAVDANVDETRR